MNRAYRTSQTPLAPGTKYVWIHNDSVLSGKNWAIVVGKMRIDDEKMMGITPAVNEFHRTIFKFKHFIPLSVIWKSLPIPWARIAPILKRAKECSWRISRYQVKLTEFVHAVVLIINVDLNQSRLMEIQD